MRCIPALPFLFIAVTASASVNATTWDDIARLEAHKHTQQNTGVSIATQPAEVLHRLSDGRQVNLRDWKIVLFMSSSCPHCHAFDPVLKAIAKDTGFSVFPYTLDGRGDASWPQAVPAPPMVITEFFAQGLPIATLPAFLLKIQKES